MVEKRQLDNILARKKQLLSDLHADLLALPPQASADPELQTLIDSVINSASVKEIIDEANKERESQAKDFKEYRAMQAQKRIKQINVAAPNIKPEDTVKTIRDLEKEIKELSSQQISTREAIRKLSVS